MKCRLDLSQMTSGADKTGLRVDEVRREKLRSSQAIQVRFLFAEF
jgi:hypothetical protein